MKKHDRHRHLEFSLIIIVIALTALLHQVQGFKLVVLNLFYLPVVLAAFFLGRYRAGVFALFCVVAASVVTVLGIQDFAVVASPVAVGLAVTIWGAVMGLNALLVGTLSDERMEKIDELHDAYHGVVEVLARYLASADPTMKDRSLRIAELAQATARQMRLSSREVDDIRVAALLQGIENVEVTARVIGKAIGEVGARARSLHDQHTFHGSDLVQSLGSVLTGALPLLCTSNRQFNFDLGTPQTNPVPNNSFGARIIQTVSAYEAMVESGEAGESTSSQLLVRLRDDISAEHHPAVVHALQQVLAAQNEKAPATPRLTAEPAGV